MRQEETMANHHPYIDWILSDDPLPADADRKMRAHLAQCPSCRSAEDRWQSAREAIRSAEMLSPAAGFTGRWRAMAGSRSRTVEPRQAWVFLAASGLGALVMAALLALQTSAQGLSLSGVFTRQVTMAVGTLSDWAGLGGTFGLAAWIVLKSIPVGAYLLVVFLVCLLGLAGLILYYRSAARGGKR
jgi:Putative zinc-finger